MNTLLMSVTALLTTTTTAGSNSIQQHTCPYLTVEHNHRPAPIRIPQQKQRTSTPIQLCFNASDLFTNSEETLTTTCTWYRGTGTDTHRADILSFSSTVLSKDDLLYCPTFQSKLPSVDLLVITVANSWHTHSYEHHVLSGIDPHLKKQLFHSTTMPLKFNLGSGIALNRASNGWINFDAMSDFPKNEQGREEFNQDWASEHFQTNVYDRKYDTTASTTLPHEHHLIRWDVDAGLYFQPDSTVDVINIHCVLYYTLYHRGPSSVEFLIKEAYRVLKPTGVLRIAERSKNTPEGKELRALVLAHAGKKFGTANVRYVGPLRTFSGDAEILHLTHSICVNCMKKLILRQKQQKQQVSATGTEVSHDKTMYVNNVKFEQTMVDQGCK